MGLCVQLSSKRRVTLSEFKGRSLVSIREFYVKDGKEMPSAKGDSTMDYCSNVRCDVHSNGSSSAMSA